METYKEVLPCGILRIDGEVYWLLSPEPISPDSWQHFEQQRWSVVPYLPFKYIYLDEYDEEGEKIRVQMYGYARHLICTNPVIEYRYVTEPIKVLQVMDIPEEKEPEDEFEPEPEDLKVAERLFLAEVGAIPSEDAYADENQRALELMQEGLDYGNN